MQTTKILLFSFLVLSAKAGFSQELHGKAKEKKDSINRMSEEDKRNEINKFTKMDLSQKQIEEIKEIQTAGKKERAEIKNDNTLTPDMKKAKMKALHKAQNEKVMQKLTPEQQMKFKEIGKDKLKKGNEDND